MSKACLCKQYDYVLRGRLDSAQDSAFRFCGILPCEEMVRAFSTKSEIAAKYYPERQTLEATKTTKYIYPWHSWIARKTPTLEAVGSNPIG